MTYFFFFNVNGKILGAFDRFCDAEHESRLRKCLSDQDFDFRKMVTSDMLLVLCKIRLAKKKQQYFNLPKAISLVFYFIIYVSYFPRKAFTKWKKMFCKKRYMNPPRSAMKIVWPSSFSFLRLTRKSAKLITSRPTDQRTILYNF